MTMSETGNGFSCQVQFHIVMQTNATRNNSELFQSGYEAVISVASFAWRFMPIAYDML